MTIRVSEIYGGVTSRQGEGELLGVAMPFVRVAGCNLSCSWCDSAYTWKPGYAYTAMSAQEILDALDPLLGDCRWVSITGGEPTLYNELADLVEMLWQRHIRVIVETNGLRHPGWLWASNVFVSCSPKLPGSGQDTPARRKKVAAFVAKRADRWEWLTQYKFVIATPDDLAALGDYCAEVGIDLPGASEHSTVYLQPDGYVQPTARYLEQLQWLQESAPAGVRVTPQVHRLVHGPDARAV